MCWNGWASRPHWELAQSNNSKVVVIGAGKKRLPVIGGLLLDPADSAILPQTDAAPGIHLQNKTDGRETPEKTPDSEEKIPAMTYTQNPLGRPETPTTDERTY